MSSPNDPERLAGDIQSNLQQLREDVTAVMRQIECKAATTEAVKEIEDQLNRMPHLMSRKITTAVKQGNQQSASSAEVISGHVKEAEEALRRAEKRIRRPSVAWMSVTATACLITGGLFGMWMFELAQTNGYVRTASMNPEKIAAVKWAQSETGRYARKFMKENPYLARGACPRMSRDVENGKIICSVWRVAL